MWNKLYSWYDKSPWWKRAPAGMLFGVCCVFAVILGFYLFIVLPISILRWWSIVYFIAVIIWVVVEIVRDHQKTQKEEAEKLAEARKNRGW